MIPDKDNSIRTVTRLTFIFFMTLKVLSLVIQLKPYPPLCTYSIYYCVLFSIEFLLLYKNLQTCMNITLIQSNSCICGVNVVGKSDERPIHERDRDRDGLKANQVSGFIVNVCLVALRLHEHPDLKTTISLVIHSLDSLTLTCALTEICIISCLPTANNTRFENAL